MLSLCPSPPGELGCVSNIQETYPFGFGQVPSICSLESRPGVKDITPEHMLRISNHRKAPRKRRAFSRPSTGPERANARSLGVSSTLPPETKKARKPRFVPRSMTHIMRGRPIDRGSFGILSQHAMHDRLVIKHGPLRRTSSVAEPVYGKVNDGMVREANAISQLEHTAARTFQVVSPKTSHLLLVEPKYRHTAFDVIRTEGDGLLPVEPGRFMEYAEQLRSQLACLHSSGFFHGDVTIRNVMTTLEEDNMVLIDLSGAGILDTCHRQRDFAGVLRGDLGLPFRTMEWSRAPEAMFDAPEPHGVSSDAWGLGCVLLTLATRCTLGSNFEEQGFEFSTSNAAFYLEFFGFPPTNANLVRYPMFQTFLHTLKGRDMLSSVMTASKTQSPLRFVRGQDRSEEMMAAFRMGEAGWSREDVILAMDVLRALFDFDTARRADAVETITPFHSKELVGEERNVWDVIRERYQISQVRAPVSGSTSETLQLDAQTIMPLVTGHLLRHTTDMEQDAMVTVPAPLCSADARRAVVNTVVSVLTHNWERPAGLDTIVVAMHTLWLAAKHQVWGEPSLRLNKGRVTFLDVLVFCIVNADASMGFIEAPTMVTDEHYSMVHKYLLRAIEDGSETVDKHLVGPGAHSMTNQQRKLRVEAAGVAVNMALRGATVRPDGLPRFAATARRRCQLPENSDTLQRVMLPALMSMVEDDEVWRVLFLPNAKDKLEECFVKRCRDLRATHQRR